MPWSKIKTEIHEPDFRHDSDLPGRTLSYPESVKEAITQAMEMDDRVFIMGQGVDDPSGMFGTTLGLQEQFGCERVFDTPLAENALMGIAVGAAIDGMRPVYFHNRPDFLLLAMDQIVNHASKWHFMFGGAVNVPLVVWACIGRGWGSAAQHSQALQGLFMQIPGLRVVMPSTCHDAKGLLMSAIADENPVIIIEHRFNFQQKGFVPEMPFRVPFGKGIVRREGSDVTIVALSNMNSEAFKAAETLAGEGIAVELIDMRSLRPLDEEIVLRSITRTGRLIVADTGWEVGGFCAEIAALAADKGFGLLKAPVKRITTADVPTPAGYTLEREFYPTSADIADAVREIINY